MCACASISKNSKLTLLWEILNIKIELNITSEVSRQQNAIVHEHPCELIIWNYYTVQEVQVLVSINLLISIHVSLHVHVEESTHHTDRR